MEASGFNLAWWVALALTLVIGLVGLIVTWRLAVRRTLVSVHSEGTAIAPEFSAVGLEVVWTGHPIDNPVLARVAFTNHGPSDLSPTDFEGGLLACQLDGAQIISVLGTKPERVEVLNDQVIVRPSIFTSDETIEVQLLVSGRFIPKTTVKLVNVREGSPGRGRWALAATLPAIALALVIALTVSSLLLNTFSAAPSRPASVPGTATVAWTQGLGVWLRSNVGGDSERIRIVPEGTRLVLICSSEGQEISNGQYLSSLWYRVTWNGAEGYVSDAFLDTGATTAVVPKC